VGVLEVRGYENKKDNGFEQFLENYINEKIYQLSSVGDAESLVCSLIEGSRKSKFSSKNHGGLLPLLDEMSQLQASDQQFLSRLFMEFKDTPGLYPPSLKEEPLSFSIEHFFDRVSYHCKGFCEHNKDFIWEHIVKVLEQSEGDMISNLFPKGSSNRYANKLPETIIAKLQLEVARLVAALEVSRQHFVRFPLENVSILLSPLLEEVEELNALQLAQSELVRQRESSAILVQSVWRAHKAKSKYIQLKKEEQAILVLQRTWRRYRRQKDTPMDVYDLQKLRRESSLKFQDRGMYLDEEKQALIHGSIEGTILFADEITKYNRSFKSQSRILVLTDSFIYIISKRFFGCHVHDRLDIKTIQQVSLSVFQDDYFILQHGPHEVLYSSGRKTEFLTKLAKLKKLAHHPLRICLSRSGFEYFIKSGRRRSIKIRQEANIIGSTLLATGTDEAGLFVGLY